MSRRLVLLALAIAASAFCEAAMPLVTQYIAPVTAPTWENAVTNAPYGTGEGFTFGLAAAGDNPDYKNYIIKVNGVYKSAWSKWVKLNQDGVEWSWPATYPRSVASSRRYLYPVTAESLADGAIVFYPGKNRVELTAWKITEPLVANNHLDDQGSGADYVQCVHTDWVYTVTFTANGGAGKMNPFTFTNSAALPACAYIKEGHSFKGWNTKADGSGTFYADGSDVSEDLALYATWTAALYRVTYDINYEGGSVSPASKTVTYGMEYGTLPSPARSGYSFDGWYGEASGGSEITAADVVAVAGDHVLYAHWTDLSLTVNFDANYEGGSVSPGSKTVTSDGTYGDLPVPERTGYVFDGWYTAATGGSRVEANTHVVASAEHTLFAHWTAGRYSISLDPQGGALWDQSIDLVYGEQPKVSPSAPVYESGTTFLGYYTEPDGGGVRYWDHTGKWIPGGVWTNIEVTVLYAYAATQKVNVRFDANGGTCEQHDKEVEYKGVYGELPIPSRAKHTFLGWFTTISDDGSEVTPETTVLTTSSPITLYAHWRDNTVGIRFDANGGKINGASVTNVVGYYEIGTAYGDFPLPTNSVHALFFAGWWTSTNPVDRVQVFETNVVDSATTNLYARWKSVAEAELCTLTFKLPDGGTCLATNALEGTEYGDYFPDPAPTDGDYTLFGWYAGNVRVRATDVVQGSATLTAKWTLGAFNDAWNCYDIVFDTMTGGKYFGPWTMDERGVARSAYRDPAKGELSTLKMTPESPGKLALELKASCPPPQEGKEPQACLDLYRNNLGGLVERIAGPQDFKMSKEVHVNSNDMVYLEYYCDPKLVVSGYKDCGWAQNLVWTPDDVATPIDDWTSYSSVRRGTWTTGGAAPWTTIETNADLAASGAIADGRSSWIKLAVPARAGVLSFKWRTSCEAGYVDTNGVYRACDGLEFSDERGEGLRIEGVSGDFAEVVWTNDVEAAHVFTWRYVKDGDVAEGEDGAWLKDVVWTPFPRQPSPMRIFIW